MSWAEFKVLKDNIDAGIVSLPTLIIKDTLGIMQGKTLTITDENEYFTHQVVFPQGETLMVVTLEYMCEWEVSFTNGGSTIRLTATVDRVGGVVLDNATLTSWSNGTDAEIVQMVALADAGGLDLSDCWHVGDEREVTLSAMSATGVGESHVEQTVTFVLMNVGGKTLTNAVASGRTECSFIVGMKDCLKEPGYMNSTNTNVWDSCARRTWCNNTFKNSLPQTLLPIFKQFQNITAQTYDGTINQITDDYFAIPAAAEVFKGDSTWGQGGTAGIQTAYSNLTEFNALNRFTWYETDANRIKKLDGSNYAYWTRSPRIISPGNITYCSVEGIGTSYSGNSGATGPAGISPFCVI